MNLGVTPTAAAEFRHWLNVTFGAKTAKEELDLRINSRLM
jgi:hypothetical protein